jgi:hypothetical protein
VEKIQQHRDRRNGPRLRAPFLEIAETIYQLRSISQLRAEHPDTISYKHYLAVRTAIAIVEHYRDQLLGHPAADPAPARALPLSAPNGASE